MAVFVPIYRLLKKIPLVVSNDQFLTKKCSEIVHE